MNEPSECLETTLKTHPVLIRNATSFDVDAVHRLITENLVDGHLLPRPLNEIECHVPNFFVATIFNKIVGCGELTSLSEKFAEIRSLVVAVRHRGAGVGQSLLGELLRKAHNQGFPKICAFTHEARPFLKAGFSIVPHTWVPEKISTDCRYCEWFRRCHQFAVILELRDS